MDINEYIIEIKHALNRTFESIDNWFDKPEGLRQYKPLNGGWTIDEILEHIGLTNHFLIILIDKGAKKALANASNLNLEKDLKKQDFNLAKLEAIGVHKSFNWIRPEHMEPKGEKSLKEVRQQLKEQVRHCSENLNQLKNGEGALYKTTMSVNNLGKINVYEYIYFLAQHGQRHIMQMEKNEAEYYGKIKS